MNIFYINEEMYDFVNDIKRAIGMNNSKQEVEKYLMRELSYDEELALVRAKVIYSSRKPAGNSFRRYR